MVTERKFSACPMMGVTQRNPPPAFLASFVERKRDENPLEERVSAATHPDLSILILLLLLLQGSAPVTETGGRILSSIFCKENCARHEEEYNIFKNRILGEMKIFFLWCVKCPPLFRAGSSSMPQERHEHECYFPLLLLTYSQEEGDDPQGLYICKNIPNICSTPSRKIFLKAKRIFIYIYLLNLMIYCDSPFHLFFPWWVCGTPIKINSGFTCTVRGD